MLKQLPSPNQGMDFVVKCYDPHSDHEESWDYDPHEYMECQHCSKTFLIERTEVPLVKVCPFCGK